MAKFLTEDAIGHFLTVNRVIRWRVDADMHLVACDVENLNRDTER